MRSALPRHMNMYKSARCVSEETDPMARFNLASIRFSISGVKFDLASFGFNSSGIKLCGRNPHNRLVHRRLMPPGTVASAQAVWRLAGLQRSRPNLCICRNISSAFRESRAGRKADREGRELGAGTDSTRCAPSWTSGTSAQVKETFIIPAWNGVGSEQSREGKCSRNKQPLLVRLA